MSVEFNTQAAVFSAISEDAAVSALVSTVVDFGERKHNGSTVYPYVAVGDIIRNEWDTDTSNGFDAVFRVHTWTNTGSAKLALDIQGAIYAVLHKQDLTITGASTINLYRMSSFVMRDPSGAHHGVCEYRGLIRIIPEVA